MFGGHKVMQVGSRGALTAWKTEDFDLPRHFNIALLVPKIDMKHH